uniref:RNA-directed DNA polymerase n=1 Tax=Strongyloides papillosus TaxID=174720 RepID=A0A0N5BZ12_STREA
MILLDEKKEKVNLNTSKFKMNSDKEKSRKRKNPRAPTGDSPARTRSRGKTEAKMVFLGKLQIPEWTKLKTETNLMGKDFDDVSASDLMDLFKNIFGCPRNSYLDILTLLKGLQSRSNDIDDVVSVVTNALKNIDVKTIRIEELAAMIILCKYQPIESIEALIIKKACEKRTRKEGTKDVPCFATAKEIVEIIKEANSYAIAVSGENREVKRVFNNKFIDKRRRSFTNKVYSDKEKSYNKRVCFKCGKPGHFIANCIGGVPIPIIGSCEAKIKLKDRVVITTVLITELPYSLYGRKELHALGLLDELYKEKVGKIVAIEKKNDSINDRRKVMENEFYKTFVKLTDGKLGLVKNFEAKLPIKIGAVTKIVPPRPYQCEQIIPLVEEKIKDYIDNGLLVQEDYPRAASPLIPIIKDVSAPLSKKNLRFVGDFSILNRSLEKNCFRMKDIAEIFKGIGENKNNRGEIICSKFDISDGYSCVKLDNESSRYACINTHQGCFRMTRLPQGISVSPGIFQKLMLIIEKETYNRIYKIDPIFNNKVKFIYNYFDDTLIVTRDFNSHYTAVFTFAKVMEDYGLKVNRGKIALLVSETDFLGIKISNGKFQIAEKRIKALKELKIPENKDELRSALGLINYNLKFCPKLAIYREELNDAMKKESFTKLSPEEVESFNKCITEICKSISLTPYTQDMNLILETDASTKAIAAILKNDKGQIIECWSRALREIERRYPVQHLEALSVIEGIEQFKWYLLFKKFRVESDHQSLTTVFNFNNGINKIMANRLQRWALRIIPYQFELCYVGGKRVPNADCLSRLLKEMKEQNGEEYLVGKIENKIDRYILADEILVESKKDNEYLEMKNQLENGINIPELKEKNDIAYVEENLIRIGERYWIPKSLREKCLNLLHGVHQSVSVMRKQSRKYFYWLNIENDIVKMAERCVNCENFRRLPKQVSDSWDPALFPLERMHADIAELTKINKYILVIQDSHTGFSDLIKLDDIRSETTGLTSKKIIHQVSGAGHQQSNGRAERLVQLLKNRYNKITFGYDKIGNAVLEEILIDIKNSINETPVGCRNESPREMLNRNREGILIKPLSKRKESKFAVNDIIQYKFHSKDFWKRAVIQKIIVWDIGNYDFNEYKLDDTFFINGKWDNKNMLENISDFKNVQDEDGVQFDLAENTLMWDNEKVILQINNEDNKSSGDGSNVNFNTDSNENAEIHENLSNEMESENFNNVIEDDNFLDDLKNDKTLNNIIAEEIAENHGNMNEILDKKTIEETDNVEMKNLKSQTLVSDKNIFAFLD